MDFSVENPISSMAWKKCPENMPFNTTKYRVDGKSPVVASKSDSDGDCTIIGDRTLPPDDVSSWGINLLEIMSYYKSSFFIGVAPFDINQNQGGNEKKCGWYINAMNSVLVSGPPHNYSSVKYGPRDEKPDIDRGYTIGVVMDTVKGKLSFVVNGITYGVAYKGIPLDKPLVPCVLLGLVRDTIKYLPNYVIENSSDYPIYPPKNFRVFNAGAHSITLIWSVDEDASAYQVEVDGNKFVYSIKKNMFTKGEFAEESEHSFRVRTIVGASMSDWSDVLVVRTVKENFENSKWKEDPCKSVSKDYYLNSTFDVATCNNNFFETTIIGNSVIPFGAIVSWTINIVKLKRKGHGVRIGVAPFDIDQSKTDNSNKCGWYLDMYESYLVSGPPFDYKVNNEYHKYFGMRKIVGEYIRENDDVGVTMDTTLGDLLFYLNNIFLGVAYKGIPLDKPLVPCVILYHNGDSVGYKPTGPKQVLMDTLQPPTGITTKSIASDSILVTWEPVGGVSFYDVEIEGKRYLETASKNMHTVIGLEPAEVYNIRVRSVMSSGFSKWSDPVKGYTLKPYFDVSGWRECPEDLYPEKMYTVYEKNPKYVSKTVLGFCTILGAAPIPLNAITTWTIKILKPPKSRPYRVYIGVSPSDIDKNTRCNFMGSGWHVECGQGELFSGPTHKLNYRNYSYRGSSISKGTKFKITMDTKKGALSYVMWGEDFGKAFGDIPLDKPLYPSVIVEENLIAFKIITADDEEKADPTKDEEEEEIFKDDKDCIIS